MTTVINRPEILTRRPLVTPGATALGTLCLFRGPAPWIDATRKLSTPLWYDKNLVDDLGNHAGAAFLDAGELQRRIESEIGPCEHRPNVQHMREGVNWISLRDETPQERYDRSVPDFFRRIQPFESHTRDPFADVPLARITTGVELVTQSASAHSLWVSPSLHDEVGDFLTLADFPEAWTAGNGVTANTWLPIRKGSQDRAGWQREVFVSFCVLAPEVADRLGQDWRAWETLRRIMESGETGAAYPTVPVAPEALECDHEWQPITPDWPKIQGCVKCRGALKVGNSVTLNANSIALTIAAAPSAPSAGTGVYYTAVDKQPLYLASDSTTTNMYGGAASAVTRVGSVNTEATTTSVAAVDLQTLSGISIAGAIPFDIRGAARLSAASNTSGGLGFKENTTVIKEAVISNVALPWGLTSSTVTAVDGYFVLPCAGPQTNYLNSAAGFGRSAYTTTTGAIQFGSWANLQGDLAWVAATITTFVLRAIATAGSTVGQKDLEVYSYSTS